MHTLVTTISQCQRMECHLNFITIVVLSIVLYSPFVQLVYADFTQLFKPNWAPHHIVTQGDNILLTLDNTTGIINAVIYFTHTQAHSDIDSHC